MAERFCRGKNSQGLLARTFYRCFRLIIGPLQLAIHVVENRHAGEQKSDWDETNKGNYHLKVCMLFLCLVPVRLFLSTGTGKRMFDT